MAENIFIPDRLKLKKFTSYLINKMKIIQFLTHIIVLEVWHQKRFNYVFVSSVTGGRKKDTGRNIVSV
jgi:hypothetical protein